MKYKESRKSSGRQLIGNPEERCYIVRVHKGKESTGTEEWDRVPSTNGEEKEKTKNKEPMLIPLIVCAVRPPKAKDEHIKKQSRPLCSSPSSSPKEPSGSPPSSKAQRSSKKV